jgi:hypothetical protein
MNWDALAAVGQLVSALAVLFSLVYLAQQVREYTRVARADAEREFQIYWNTHIQKQLFGDTERSNLTRRGFADFDNLTADERAVMHTVLGDVVDCQRIAMRLHDNGQMADDLYETVNNVTSSILRSPGGMVWWPQVRQYYLNEEKLDQLIAMNFPAINETPVFSYDPEEAKVTDHAR